ncbi:MAG: UTP--glucose-1-phosphate uridylyltransferase [Proteobacteria bacterium]|nr:UTP--glucose-1-phosphate uridylyltransferase [Cystobacterineae bacterium]MCL2259346.1 UTP--glucose-1-phosphate uridylyltransferase [Cystobacterineae bacterium]MCL2314083.1 UTP--glucose-1-phosphate uridylyltransferase [Pseudomonadota bacterium]
MSKPTLSKVVVPAAGLGTRFLPFSKVVPKEMLPIVDKPAVQYIAEEAVAAGAKQMLLVTSRNKESMEDHFDMAFELEAVLRGRKKESELEMLSKLSKLIEVASVRQQQPLGLGHAVLCAKPWVGDEPIGVMLPDDLLEAPTPCMRSLWECFARFGHSMGVVALMEVPWEKTHQYGIVSAERVEEGVVRIRSIVEKPPSNPPSNLAVIGRYMLPPTLFGELEKTGRGAGGEIQLTDALARMVDAPGLLGYLFKGRRFDTGDKLGFLEANVAYALKRPELRAPFLAYLRQLLETEST